MDIRADEIFIGYLRNESRTTKERRMCLDGKNAPTHYMLISATKGRDKSNPVKIMLWDLLDRDYCGLRPHTTNIMEGTVQG